MYFILASRGDFTCHINLAWKVGKYISRQKKDRISLSKSQIMETHAYGSTHLTLDCFRIWQELFISFCFLQSFQIGYQFFEPIEASHFMIKSNSTKLTLYAVSSFLLTVCFQFFILFFFQPTLKLSLLDYIIALLIIYFYDFIIIKCMTAFMHDHINWPAEKTCEALSVCTEKW